MMRKQISNEKKLETIARHEAGEKRHLLAKELGVTSRTIKRWQESEDQLRGIRGDGWEDVGDERRIPAEIEYGDLLSVGFTPDELKGKRSARYAKWLGKMSEGQFVAKAVEVGLEESEVREALLPKFRPWLRPSKK
jgi:hypothetical protein